MNPIDPSFHLLVSSPWSRPDWYDGRGEATWLGEIHRALEQGADVSAKWMGETPLWMLLTHDDDWSWSITAPNRNVLDSPYAKAAKMLIEHGADVNAHGTGGDTILHCAAHRWSHYWPANHAVELLIALGADTSLKNTEGKTALDLAGGKARELLAG